MKLLTPFQQKDQQQADLTKKILRIQEVEKLVTQTNANLARAEFDFNSMLARNREKWALEEEEHTNRVESMEQEIKELENRKNQALVPIQLYKDEADKIMENARDLAEKVKQREEYVEELTEQLTKKLTEVSDREEFVANEEKRLEVAKQGIIAQQEATKQGVERLSKEMIMFHEKQQTDEASLSTRRRELEMAEINFNARLDKYQRDLEALKIFDRQLKDERATLDREIARRKKK